MRSLYNYHALLVESLTLILTCRHMETTSKWTLKQGLHTWHTMLELHAYFNQTSQSSMWDQNKIIANLNYVGVLKEILLVDYYGLCLVLFKCSWIPPNLHGNARTICQDEHRFWQVNFQWQLPPTMEPYVLPITMS